MAFCLVTAAEAIAREPVIPIARLPSLAVGVVPAGLARDISAVQRACQETVLRGLLLGVSGKVTWRQEFVDEILVFAYAVAEHAPVVAVVVNAPLNFDNVSGIVGYDWCVAPVGRGLVVVYADTGVVATGTAPSYLCGGEIGPRGYGLEDGALGTRV